VIDAALRTPADALPGWTGVDLGAAGYVVVKVNRVVPRQAPDAQRAQQERQQYEQWLTTAEGMAYYELLKQRFKVQIKAPRPDAAAQVTAEN
jgi:peptidyl-prolyl cis-trans isomerase D